MVNEIETGVQEKTQAYHNWFYVVIASDMLAEPNYHITARSNHFKFDIPSTGQRSFGTSILRSRRARHMTAVVPDV
jgi:hypothetical protein